MPSNTAAWLAGQHAALEVKPAPYIAPRPNEIVVRNAAVAINPIDWVIQQAGTLLFPWIKYPFVLGSDLAGEVIEVGQAVTRFQVGDRVLAHAVAMDKRRNRAAEGAFQLYTVVLAHMAAPLPNTLPYESAAVLPLGLSTAACGLFQKDHLALEYPSLSSAPTGKTLLVWGGSTSVGSNAIQLAVAAGYEVVTTASPANFAYVQKLGASQVFDYHSKTVVPDIIQALRGKALAGALAIGPTSGAACLDIIHACDGNKFVSLATYPLSFETLPNGPAMRLQMLRQAPKLAAFGVSMLKSRLRHIGSNFIFGTTLMDNEVSRIIYEDFLPSALAAGRYQAAPPPQVVGTGLECLQAGLDRQRGGVSAQKIVVSLEG